MTGFNDEGRDLSPLLHDAVSDVEPADRLAEIRAAVAPRRRRVGWYAAGGTMLAAAAAVTAIAVVTSQTTPRADDDPGPGPATSSPSPSSPSSPAAPLPVEAIYYIGDTPAGPRLYRYWESPDPGQDVLDLLTQTPADPDYRTAWAPGSFASVTFDGPVPDQIEVTIADASLRDRPAGMTEAEAALAVEQVIYTVQAAAGGRLPVQFRFGGNPIDQVLGVPTSEPVTNGPPLDVLSLVSISDPSEGLVLEEGSVLTVKGAANSFEANVVWRLQRHEGTGIVGEGYFTAEGYMGDKLFEFEGEIDLAGVPAGRYLLMVSTDDPSGQGRFYTDTRTVVVE